MTPIRVQLSRKRGYKMPENTVKVARPGKWGNPYVVGEDGTRAECVEKFRGYAAVCLDDVALAELRGKNLACWCKLPEPGEPDLCHAAVLLKIANS